MFIRTISFGRINKEKDFPFTNGKCAKKHKNAARSGLLTSFQRIKKYIKLKKRNTMLELQKNNNA
jgi:hypothetical protein